MTQHSTLPLTRIIGQDHNGEDGEEELWYSRGGGSGNPTFRGSIKAKGKCLKCLQKSLILLARGLDGPVLQYL